MSTVRTNISNWAINHCFNRSFNLVEAWVQGRLTVTDLLFLSVELYLEVLGGELISTRGKRGQLELQCFDT